MTDEAQSKVAQAAQALKPSTSTVASAVGGVLVNIALWVARDFAHVDVPADIAAQLAVAVTLLAGFFFSGGRSNDTV